MLPLSMRIIFQATNREKEALCDIFIKCQTLLPQTINNTAHDENFLNADQDQTTTTTYIVIIWLIVPLYYLDWLIFRVEGLDSNFSVWLVQKRKMEIFQPCDGVTRLLAGVPHSHQPASQRVLWSNIRLSGFTDFIVRMKSTERSWFEQINKQSLMIQLFLL